MAYSLPLVIIFYVVAWWQVGPNLLSKKSDDICLAIYVAARDVE